MMDYNDPYWHTGEPDLYKDLDDDERIARKMIESVKLKRVAKHLDRASALSQLPQRQRRVRTRKRVSRFLFKRLSCMLVHLRVITAHTVDRRRTAHCTAYRII